MKQLRSAILFAAALIGGWACGSADSGMSSGQMSSSMGATQGGLQGMRLVRELIAQGMIPPADAFTVEGMFSEHDLPLEGAACVEILCLQAAVGIAPTLDEKPATWTQIGMSSAIDPDTYVRPTQTVIAVVDVSGSMGWGYGEDGTPGEVARKILNGIAGRLHASDRMAIVIYSSKASIHLPITAGDQKEAFKSAINGLKTGGVTNMEAGLQVAYELAAKTERDTHETRLVLFTDVQPNVGNTGATDFIQLAETGASKGAFLTVLGLGVGMGPEILSRLSAVKGANGFELFKPEDVPSFFKDNWPWFLSPIAFNLRAEVVALDGYTLAAGYGFASPSATKTSLKVESVFLSKRRGGMLIQFTPPGSGSVPFAAQVNLSYTDRTGTIKRETLNVDSGGNTVNVRGQYFAQHSVGKAVALAILVSSMKEAAGQYAASPEEAEKIMHDVVARIEADAGDLKDSALTPEVKLAKDMLALVKGRAVQGTLYGNGVY